MLKEILLNLSQSDCYNLLSEKQKTFYESLDSEKRANLDLCNMIYEGAGVSLLLTPNTRETLIERLNKQHLSQIFSNLNIDISTIHKPYEYLKKLTENEPTALIRALNLYSDYQELLKHSSEIEDTIRVEPQYPLYPYQLDCCKKIRTFQRDETVNRVLLHLPTGAGKTRSALSIICEFLRENPDSLVVWLADTRELCEQALEEFQKAWTVLGNHALPCYAYFGTSDLSISGITRGFMVASLQKLNSLGKKDKNALAYLYQELRKNTAMVVFDEAHMAIARTYKETVEGFLDHSESNAFLLGLSATPGRMMGDDEKMHEENQRLSDFFHNNKVTMRVKGYNSPLEYLVEKQYLAQTSFITLNYDDIELSGFDLNTRRCEGNNELLKALSSNNNRNTKLFETILNELEKGENQIIVFACTVTHADELTMMLTGSGVACRSIDGNTPAIARSAAIADYRNKKVRVLINYGVLTAGFDAPCTNVAIIARPTSSLVQYSQMAGRAMRGKRSGGNHQCRVYTVNDNIPEFRSVCHAFTYWDQMWKPE